ncbi:flagellar motor switch protein FliM [Myxococcota bacterium]|jgi:flagellar motor switch protein FliM|nr:flagellar motor switch protein FliM [Myxococcota bacterium]
MSDQILSQTEIDALLSAVNDGKIDVEQEAESPVQDTGAGAVKYDLLSQDRIIRGRMPTLDIINDRFARQFRITLSNSLRKIIQVSVESTSLMKYGEFLNYLPIPSCLNIVRLNPLRGSCILAIEAKLIFAFLNNFFGGATNAQEKVEGRDFTAIELMIIRKVVNLLLEDLQRAWQPVYPLQGEYLRTEINPQFLAVVPPSDVVVLTSFELEMENLRGTVQVVIPYSTIEPIRQHLSSGIQAENASTDSSWHDQIMTHLMDVPVEGQVLLGQTSITVRELIDLKVGDVITLGQSVGDPLVLSAEGSPKFEITPAVKAGYLAAKIVKPIIKNIERPRRPLAEQAEGPKSDRFGRTTLE